MNSYNDNQKKKHKIKYITNEHDLDRNHTKNKIQDESEFSILYVVIQIQQI